MEFPASSMAVGSVYWITGISGAGKTTIGRLLFARLKKRRLNVVFLDGDEMRAAFAQDLGHSRGDRERCAMRYSRLCKLLSDQGQDVVIATISMFHSCRRWNRENMPGYREIYVRAPMAVLRRRDTKGLYRRGAGLRGSRPKGSAVVGIDIEAEEPEAPDVVLENDGSREPAMLLRELCAALKV